MKNFSRSWSVKSLFSLPTGSTLSYNWNFGSMLGLCLMLQMITGFILSTRYTPSEDAFFCVINMTRELSWGAALRALHSNGASMFFFIMYMHIGRGMYYMSFHKVSAWIVGCIILLLSMVTAFLGYVLPMGQMSLWGGAVITNLLSVFPIWGADFVVWTWGGPVVTAITLNRFYSLHYILPFLICFLSLVHLNLLHILSSSNPMGIRKDMPKDKFVIYFSWKDCVGFYILFMILLKFSFFNPHMFLDPENFLEASPLTTPAHIQPEWYFLFAYTILRSIPSKPMGVLALVFSVLIFFFLPLSSWFKLSVSSKQANPVMVFSFPIFVSIIITLTFLGACPAEGVYLQLGAVCSMNYFMWFFCNFLYLKLWAEEY